MQEVAQAASIDGLGNSAVDCLKQLGSDGAHPANIERDFHRQQGRSAENWLPNPESMLLPMKSKKGKRIMTEWAVMPPHRVFAALCKRGLGRTALWDKDENLAAWWQGAKLSQHEGLVNHPALAVADERALDQCVPVRTHGVQRLAAAKPTRVLCQVASSWPLIHDALTVTSASWA